MIAAQVQAQRCQGNNDTESSFGGGEKSHFTLCSLQNLSQKNNCSGEENLKEIFGAKPVLIHSEMDD